LLVFVELAVTWPAEEGKVVDVTWAPYGGVVGDEVMGFAAPVIGAAEHTLLVSSGERDELRSACGSDALSKPERLAVGSEDGADELGVTPVIVEYPIGNWTDADLNGRRAGLRAVDFGDRDGDHDLWP
jgi:hypothetical protein